MNTFAKHISQTLGLKEHATQEVIDMLNEGNTIAFISRYRKERTGGMNEVEITDIKNLLDKMTDLAKRKETITNTISDLGKLTPELQQRINDTWDAATLEDIYLPYKPKRRTKAQVARERGLEPLATLIFLQRETTPLKAAQKFVTADVPTADDAIQGACHIIAETISEDERTRHQLRHVFSRQAIISSKVVKTKMQEEDAQKYADYFDCQEPLRRISSHRLLAMRRGENEGILRLSISVDKEECQNQLHRQYLRGNGACTKLVAQAADDALSRLLLPSLENEFAALAKQKADEEAILVFAQNLRQLLLAAPLGQKRVMGVDPGFRTGCKIVCLNEQGNLLHHTVLFLSRNDGGDKLLQLVKRYDIEAIAIGNGTASRETKQYIASLNLPEEVQTFVVSEDGASVYSASAVAREEFPQEDVTVRGAVSIARRLVDPLAELVKIDPKSIGVGQYQHDVDQSALKKSLDQTVESCVNTVGVDLNTASPQLLAYVSGLTPTLAKNIVEHRRENGAFSSRAQLKKVPRLGPATFQQCAAFLRINNAANPLDNSAVHPESYHIAKQMAADLGMSVKELIANKEACQKIEPKRYVTAEAGLPTIHDIIKELEKPSRDPREKIEVFEFSKDVATPDDLIPGMVLPGIVTNITNFGAFVDIGVHQDGLVHISQLSNKFIKTPSEAVHLHQHVKVRVVEVDRTRKRIALSMKGV